MGRCAVTAQDAAQDGAHDRAFVVLPADECRTLLATRQLGRIGLADGTYPLILPVNYVLDGDAVVIRTDSPKITAAADHTRVAFEVDDVDERTRSGWSVLVQALAEEVTGEPSRRAGRAPAHGGRDPVGAGRARPLDPPHPEGRHRPADHPGAAASTVRGGGDL